jgi:hypothetical protein
MTWTYNISQTTTLDLLRFIIGDTDVDRQLLQDEELNAVLARKSSQVIPAAIDIAESLEAKFIRRAESRSGDIIADFLTVAGKYRDLANRLRKRGSKGYAIISITDRCNDKKQCTYPQPSIQRDEWDYYGIPE